MTHEVVERHPQQQVEIAIHVLEENRLVLLKEVFRKERSEENTAALIHRHHSVAKQQRTDRVVQIHRHGLRTRGFGRLT